MKIIDFTELNLSEQLSEVFPNICFKSELDTEAVAVIGNVHDFTDDALDKLPNLKWIQICSAGYDGFNIDYLKQRCIMFTNAKDIYSIPIAEDVVCKILIDSTNAMTYWDNKNKHLWNKNTNRRELTNQTIGIIGTGSIATEIAKRLCGFNVNIIGYKRTPVITLPYFNAVYTGKQGFEHFLSKSDYIIVTADLNSQTRYMINKESISKMKDGSKIINISRGELVQQTALIEAIESGKIKYAGLDVFEDEPLPENNPLWNLPQVYITPHASGIAEGNKEHLFNLISENILHFTRNEPMLNQVF